MNTEIKIIIVEDNEADADLLRREVTKLGIGFTAVVVETRSAFIKALENFGADLILSDYSLPAFDAVTAFGLVQKKVPGIPFIIVSGVIGEEKAVELIKDGVTDYVMKDNMLTLNPKIKRALKDADDRREKAFVEEKLRLQTAELIGANMELAFQVREKETRAAELAIANEELVAQNEEKELRAAELIMAYRDLKNTEEKLTEHVRGLKEMMFIASHKIRQPVTNILGIYNLLAQSMNSPEKLIKLMGYVKKSVLDLDAFTKELSVFMDNLEQTGNKTNGREKRWREVGNEIAKTLLIT
jgi:DNA-binding response OmpR family regulator